ncbi:MAG: hypothetical protein QOG37_1344, partial [Mycobacterium sp.]|nr:hypothetical protein [Mycobacterium sp.]
MVGQLAPKLATKKVHGKSTKRHNSCHRLVHRAGSW